MSSFGFFLFLTMTMAFLLNWIFMTYFHTCPPVMTETQKLVAQMESTDTIESDDDDDFFQ